MHAWRVQAYVHCLARPTYVPALCLCGSVLAVHVPIVLLLLFAERRSDQCSGCDGHACNHQHTLPGT